MKTFKEMCDELKRRLMIVDSSTLYTDDIIKKVINDAHQWATSEYNWPEYSKALKAVTFVGHDYYDYPLSFQTFSITNLFVDNKRYFPKNFFDFQDFRNSDNPDTSKRYYATYGRWFFLYPTPSASNLVIAVYGQTKADDLVSNSDTTIFSGYDEKGNEAIVLKGLAVCVETPAMTDTGKTNKAENSEAKAKRLLSEIFAKVAGHQQTHQHIDKPLFNVPNFFPSYGYGAVGNTYYNQNQS